ncbi:MAG: LPS export ABC transporter periplasmic protein LptC [bacterium]|nr:LPS export ABC transporter periplasmic protein LptC [bacterium]
MKKLLTFIIAGISVIFLSCGKDEKISFVENKVKGPQLVIDKFSITATNMGKTEWIFHARKAVVFEDKNLIDADEINIDFFIDKKGEEISSHLVAIKGNVNTKTNDMEAVGAVVLTSGSGNTLFTEKVKWLSAAQKFFTEEAVKVEKKDSIITGIGMEADPNLENVRIFKDVKVEAKE